MKLLLPKMLAAPFLLSLVACASTAPQAPRAAAPADTVPASKTTVVATPPTEDLRAYRLPLPAVPSATAAPINKSVVPPTNHVNGPAEQRLRDQAVTNQNVKYAQGYRILAYLGLERDQAMAIRRAIISRYPDETDYLTFKSPVYRLYVGDYLTKLEAARAQARLRGLTQRTELEATQVLLNKKP